MILIEIFNILTHSNYLIISFIANCFVTEIFWDERGKMCTLKLLHTNPTRSKQLTLNK